MRTTKETRRKLEEAAHASGRSLLAEVEARLEASFAKQETAGGREMWRLALLLASAFGTAANLRAAGTLKEAEWLTDPEAYRAGMVGVLDALLIGMPDSSAEDMAREIERLKAMLLSRLAHGEIK